jgi:hypothetical protein
MPRRLSLLASSLLLAAAAGAEEIGFDDVPAANANAPALGEEYAHLGVHFIATDDGSVWSGMSAGDPGGWGLEGTNGTNFVGFNGTSYRLSVVFDDPVREFKLDVARSAGSRTGDGFIVRGYRDGAMVEEVSLVLSDVNAWITVELAEEVDGVEWVGTGTRRHPFGVDNLRWSAEPARLEVAIDVKPGSPENRVNPFARGVVPVALLGSDALDVALVDVASLRFGSETAPAAPAVHSGFDDVDGDGHVDLVTHHRIPMTGIAAGDKQACLAGQLVDGTPLWGCDEVHTVPLGWLARRAAEPSRGSGPRR